MNSSIDELVSQSAAKADAFVKQYYSFLDLAPDAHRTNALLPLYSPTARIAWNGNPIPVTDLSAFVERLPQSDHRFQAYDCHPIAGSAIQGAPPSLIVSVTGQVTHNGKAHPPPGTVPSNPKQFEALPRVFSQSFILAWTPGVGATEAAYTITSDSYRFV